MGSLVIFSFFGFRSNMKNASSVGLYIKLFQITLYVNDLQTLNNPGSGQPEGALKIGFTLHFDTSHPSSSPSSSHSPSEPLRRSVAPGDLRSPQRR